MGAALAWAEDGWELPPCDLLIDAVIGCGLRGEPRGPARNLIQLANSNAAPILSLDIPSGVDSGSGSVFTPHVQAAATLTLALPKAGFRQIQRRPSVARCTWRISVSLRRCTHGWACNPPAVCRRLDRASARRERERFGLRRDDG